MHASSTTAVPSIRYPIRQARAGRLVLTELHYAPGSWLAPHAHSSIQLVLTVSGGAAERIGRKEWQLSRGHLLVRDAHVVHTDIIGAEGARALCIEPAESNGTVLGHALRHRRDGHVIESPAIGALGQRILAEAWQRDPASSLLVEGWALALVGLVVRDGAPEPIRVPAWLVRGRERLLDAPESPPSVAELAAEAGVHPGHFYRAFRRAYGMSPAACVLEARLGKACELLRQPELALATIARRLGFADQSHFGRAFRAGYGRSPGAFRAEALGRVTRLDPPLEAAS